MKNPRKLLRSLTASSAVLLAACAGGGQSLQLSPPNGPTYYFRGYARVDTSYLDRYACSDPHLLLKCSCASRLAQQGSIGRVLNQRVLEKISRVRPRSLSR